MTDIIVIFLAILATYRLARLISIDTILEPVRLVINRKAAELNSGWYNVAEWINCAHCIGVWISFFMVIVISLAFRWSFLFGILVWFAVAGGQSFLCSLVEGEDANS